MDPFEILYEDNHLLVVNKPAGIATMGAEDGPTMHSLAAAYLKQAYQKPGRAFVGVVSRLDAMTSGVLVLARTSKAASRLSSQFAKHSPEGSEKVYLAMVEGAIQASAGELVDHVRKDDAAHRMRVVGSTVPDAKEARLRYHRLAVTEAWSLVAVRLLTGRKHQIRLQFADRGHPVIGDRKYGSNMRFSDGIALHSWRLKIFHPTQRNAIWFQANPPSAWNPWLGRLRGDQKVRWGHDLEVAISRALQIDLGEET